jgi:sugar fermentation stimulation protein A
MPADEIDPAYGAELRKAYENGVEIVVYDVCIDLEGIHLGKNLPWQL